MSNNTLKKKNCGVKKLQSGNVKLIIKTIKN